MSGKSRATKFRQKKQAEGYKSIAVTIAPEAVQALAAMKNEFGWTQREAVSHALAYAAADLSAMNDFIEGKKRLEQRNATDRAKDIQDIMGMKRLLAEFEARIANLEHSTPSGAASVEVQDILEDEPEVSESETPESVTTQPENTEPEMTEAESSEAEISAKDEIISTTASGKKIRITSTEKSEENRFATETSTVEPKENYNTEPKNVVDRTVIRPVQTRMPGVFTPKEKDELLNFAAHCFVQYGQTISRSRTYRMAQDAGLNIHSTEEEFGKFLQENLGEIRRRYTAMKDAQ